jgi:hypothetical protein
VIYGLGPKSFRKICTNKESLSMLNNGLINSFSNTILFGRVVDSVFMMDSTF